MKRLDQMLKRAAGSKCSKSLQSKPVSPNAVSWTETETEAGALREDPGDDGKSDLLLRYVI